MKQHNLLRGAMLLLVFGFLFASSAAAFAGGTTPVIIVSSGDAISPSASPDPPARYAFHQTYGEPSSRAPMPTVWICLVAQKRPAQVSGSFYGGLSYDSGELIIPAPAQRTPAAISPVYAQANTMPAVVMVVVYNGMSQHQGPANPVGVVLMEEPGAWVKPSVQTDGQIQIVQRGPRRGPVR